MKRRISVLAAVAMLAALVLTACSGSGAGTGSDGSASRQTADNVSSAESAVVLPHRFGKADLWANGGVTLGMTIDEVKELLGQPTGEATFTEDQFIYGAYTDLSYNTLHLTFFDVNGGSNFTLGTIWSDSDNDIFAGGLHAGGVTGSTADEVINAFTKDGDAQPLYFSGDQNPSGEYLYGNYNANEIADVKPKGTLEYAYINKWSMLQGYDNEYLIEYYYGDPLVWSENDTVYTGDYYSMVFYVDGDTDRVKSIRLSYDLFM